MARPRKCRHVEFLPEANYFKPAGVPLQGLEEVVVAVEELEALRLRDMEGLEQEECAARMNVSRPTFVRIINAARCKVTTALVRGQAIRIEGGVYQVVNDAECGVCGRRWRQPQNDGAKACPECNSEGPGRGSGRGRQHGPQRYR